MWRALGHFIFPNSDPTWQWRRRLAFSGCSVGLWGMVHAIKFEPDHAWGAIVLAACSGFFVTCYGLYSALATYDDHQKRKLEAQAAAGAAGNDPAAQP
jgi:hypothetical protein